jgi:hypothetical protein
MFKNISSKNLLIIFIILFVLAAIFVYYDSTTEVRTFKKDIVNIDTAKVTSVSIYSKATNHKEVKLFKQGNYWMVQLENNKSVPAEGSKIKNLINQLAQIKTSSLAAQDESKWTEYQVDNIRTDSAKTVNFLRTLSHLMGNEFVDNPDQSLLGKANYNVTILSSANEGQPKTIDVSAFGDQFLLHSSQNPESYFNGNTNSLKTKIFIGKNYFFKK